MISKRVLLIAAALLVVASTSAMGQAVVNLDNYIVNNLLITSDSKLNIQSYGGYGITTTTDYSVIQGYVTTGYSGGAWNGVGINSSVCASDASQITTVACFSGQNAMDLLLATGFHGHTIAPLDSLVQTTYYGDTNMNGILDDFDYGPVDNAYLLNSIGLPIDNPGFLNGDFNMDGVVNDFDYGPIDSAYLYHVIGADYGVIDTGITHAAGAAAAVPEPSTMILLLGCCASALVVYFRKR